MNKYERYDSFRVPAALSYSIDHNLLGKVLGGFSWRLLKIFSTFSPVRLVRYPGRLVRYPRHSRAQL